VAASDRPGPALGERLPNGGRTHEFFQLVQLLLRERPGAVSPGGEGPPSRENIRFRAAASLGFSASDIESVETIESPDGTSRFQVTVNFMGLYGPASPLPSHYTEEILWAGTDGDGARDFLDLFHHRLISFVWRAWRKYRHPVHFETAGPDETTRRALCLLGVGTPGMAEGSGLPLVPLLRSAGLLGVRQRSAAGLEGFIAAQFRGVAARVQACVERWTEIPEGQRMRLGHSSARLGEDAILGTRVRDRSGAFRIVLGPLTREQFRRFLPRGEDCAEFVRLVRLYVTDPLDFDVVLRLEGADVPAYVLSAAANLPLGQLSWISPRGAVEGRAEIPIRDHDPLTIRPVAPRPAPSPAAPQPRAPVAPPPRVQPRPITTHPPTTRRP
jgi:type VI secretion system protein ImpH